MRARTRACANPYARARRPAAGLLVAAALLLAGAGALAAPPAGTPIPNTATASGSGGAVSSSNTVVAIVQAAEALSLSPGRSDVAPPGTPVSFPHRVTNLGNATTDVRLDPANLAGDGFDLLALGLAHDMNANGIFDAGDIPFPGGTVVRVGIGGTVDVLLTGTVPGSAPPAATARISLIGTTAGQGVTVQALDSVTTTAATPPALAFYDGAAFGAVIRVTQPGLALYVQAEAAACNLNPALPDTVAIMLHSHRTGDQEHFRAAETAPASGLFRILPAVPTGSGAPVHGDRIISTRRGDELMAMLPGCGATMTEASVWVDPAGVVFDARSGAPVAGAQVTLFDVTGAGNGGAAGAPARVFQADGVTPAPGTVTSDAAGRFEFPRVAPSTYRLHVAPPEPFVFPAPIPPASLAPGYLVDPSGSYGAPFTMTAHHAPVALDLPVDAGPRVTLFAEKNASRPSVEIGESIEYAVRVANRSDSSFTAMTVTDRLPPGFAYLPGSARRDGAPVADPAVAGGALEFSLGAFAAGEVTQLTYAVRVGAGAGFGDAINRAVAHAGGHASNEAVARVRVEEGLFAQSATVVGSVRLETRIVPGDAAHPAVAGAAPDAVRTLPPVGVAGVRVWLDDGTFAITDAHGRFSFTGVAPRTHALKVDPSTLPRGARLVAADHRDADQPGLRFVDVVRGDLQRTEFRLVGDSVTVRDAGERMIATASRSDDLDRALARGTSPLVAAPMAGDARALPAQGLYTGESRLPLAPHAGASLLGGGVYATAALPAAAAPPPAPAQPLDQLVRTMHPDLGFVGLADLDTLRSNQIAVRVKGPIGAAFVLRVNGETISERRVGLRVTAPERSVEAWEYVGVTLAPGLNRLEVAPPGSRGRVALRLVAPGPLAVLALDAPARAPADGRTPVPITIRTLDAAGIPNGAPTLVTLTASGGALQAVDLNPSEAGVQIEVEGGRGRVALIAPGTTGEVRVSAAAGDRSATVVIRFLPDMSPLLAVGSIEGVVGFGRTGSFGRGIDHEASRFEASIEQFASVRRDGRAMVAAHGALFARGRIRDDIALTLGYDSDRPQDQRLMRDMQPDHGPPVLGDGATRGYEAQTTGRLYARLDQGPNALLYGDFVTWDAGSPRSLAAYHRSLTGAQTRWRHAGVDVTAFASRDRAGQRVEELAGLGISGPYRLAGVPLVENTERVEILVRDRNQPSVVISRSVRQRFVDYELEPLTGRLTFRAPVPGFDADLNPVSIRVTYESETGGEPFWVSGVQSRVQLGPRIEVGGTYVDDHETGAVRGLRGVSVAARVGDHSRIESEYAVTRRLGEAPGHGSRLEFAHESPQAQGRLWLAATGTRFDNPGAGFAPGRTEGGARFTARFAQRSRFNTEALWSADAAGDEHRAGLLAAVDRPLTNAVRGEIGMRIAGEQRREGGAEPTVAALRSRLTLQLPGRPAWSGYSEYEQDVRDLDRRMLALGGEHRIHSRGRLYARHEVISSLGGPFLLHGGERRMTTIAGVDAELVRDAYVFSEYRLGDSFTGREAQAAVGLRNGWSVGDGLRLGTTFERVSTLAGANAGPATAASVSLEQTSDAFWRGSTRIEVRSSRASDTYLQTMAAAVRIDSAWTALFRHHLDRTNAHGPRGGSARLRLQLGAAWRPAGRWDGLGRMEFRYDRAGVGPDGVPAPGAELFSPGSRRRLAWILSTQAAGQLDTHFAVSLAWAGKLVREDAIGGSTPGGAQWARARTTLDLARGWDVGVQSSILVGSTVADRRYGVGAEVGRQMGHGVWLSAGYNHFGYRDDELTGTEWTRAGVYLRLRAKFDERLFGMVADLGDEDAAARRAARDAEGAGGVR